MSVKLGHEALAEHHNLAVALALRVEIGTALAAADGQTGQGVLENLLEAKELDDTKVNGRVQTQTALIRTDRRVELYAVAAVHMNLAVIVDPRHAEHDLALRLGETLQDTGSLILRVCFNDRLQSGENFRCSLNEFRLIGIKLFKVFQLFAYIRHNDRSLENRLKNKKSTGNAVFTFKSCKKISLRSFGPFCPFPENVYILPQVFRVFNMFLRKISKKFQHRKAMNFEGNLFQFCKFTFFCCKSTSILSSHTLKLYEFLHGGFRKKIDIRCTFL